MLGVHQRPVVVDKMIVPPVRGDLKLISIGNFLDDNSPVMWRGPMLHRALEQFLSDVHWGELDTLLVDMPPGTGRRRDLARAAAAARRGAARDDAAAAAQQVAVRAALMAQKTGTRVIGVVENMSWLVGTGQELFGSGGGEALAAELDVPLLGQVPLDPLLREAADAASPSSSRTRLGGGAGDRRRRRAARRAAAGHDPQGAHPPLLSQRGGARRRPST